MPFLLRGVDLRLRGPLGALLLLAILAPFWWYASIWYHTYLLSEARLRVTSNVGRLNRSITTILFDSLAPFEQAGLQLGVGATSPAAVESGPSGQTAFVSYDQLQVDHQGLNLTVRLSLHNHQPGTPPSYATAIALQPIWEQAGLTGQSASLRLALRLPTGEVFYGPPDVFDTDAIVQRVILPRGYWEIAALPTGGWEAAVASGVTLFRLLGIIPCLLLAGLAYGGLRHQAHLAGAVRHNAALFRLVMQQMPAVVWTTDAKLRLTSLFGAWPDHPEPASGAIVGMPLGAHMQPAERRPLIEAHQRTLAGESVVLEIQHAQRPYDVRVEPLRNTRGQIIGAIGIALDASERRWAEEATRRQRDLAVALGAETDLPKALELVLEAVLQIEGLDCGGIYLVDERSGNVDMAISRGLSETFVGAVSHYAADAPEAAFVRAGKPAFDLYEGPETTTSAARRSERLHAIALVPVLHHGRAIACLNFASHTTDDLSVTAHNLLETIASEIGSVIARLNAERALRESAAQLRAIFEASPISIALYDDAGITISANRACLAATGVPDVTHLQGFSVFDGTALSPDLVAQARAGKPVRGEMLYDWERIKRQRGFPSPLSGIGHYDIQLTPLELDGRRHYLAQSIDITERKQAEAALRESESRFRSAFQHSPIGMALVSPEGRWLDVNASVCSIVGYRQEELSSKTFQEITHPDDLETDLSYVRQLLAGEVQTYRMEKRYIHKDGHIVWVLLAVSPIRDGAGRLLYFISQIEDITQRKLAEAAMRESEAQFRAIFDASPVAIVLYDEQGFTLKANPACLREMGAPSVSRLQGTSLFDSTVIPPDMLALVRSGLAVRREVAYDREHIWRERGLRSPSHGVTYRDTQITPLELDGQRRYLGQSLDVTARREAEAALRDSEAWFRSVFEASPIAIGMYDAQGNVLRVNRATLDLFGLVSTDIIGGFNLFADPNLPADARATLLAGQTARFELGFDYARDAAKGPYGTSRTGTAHLYEQITPLLDQDVHGYLVQIEDITERKLAETALRDSEERYRRLVEGAPDAIGVQVDGLIRYLNPAGLRMLGAPTPATVLGRPILDFVHPDYHDHVRQSIARIVTLGVDAPLTEQKFLRLDGSVFDVEVTAMPVAFQNERGNLVIFRDVTTRRLAEEAQRQARQMEALGRLAFSVAHDFGHILAVVQTAAEMAARDGLPAATRSEDVQVIIESAVQGGTLVRQLLAFSRGEEPLMEILHLNVLLRGLQGMLCRLLGDSITLEIHLSPDATFFWGDHAQLVRVVLNLVTNARDAMPEGGRLSIAVHPEAVSESFAPSLGIEQGRYVVMVVRDTGTGIAEEDLPHIFDPFFTTNRHHGRTGLGLSVVYSILQQHRGGVRVESQLGQGTAVHVYLPAVDANEDLAEDDDQDAGDWHADGAPSG